MSLDNKINKAKEAVIAATKHLFREEEFESYDEFNKAEEDLYKAIEKLVKLEKK